MAKKAKRPRKPQKVSSPARRPGRPKKKKKKRKPGKPVPPAEYTTAEYELAIKVVSVDGRAKYQMMIDGGPMVDRWGSFGREIDPVRSLNRARHELKRAFFRRWDQARIEALGGISETVRYNARREEWEDLQTFCEKVTLPRGPAAKLRKALAARKKADQAAREAAEATRAVLRGLVGEVGMSLGDAGDLLGISKQRVAQVIAEPEE